MRKVYDLPLSTDEWIALLQYMKQLDFSKRLLLAKWFASIDNQYTHKQVKKIVKLEDDITGLKDIFKFFVRKKFYLSRNKSDTYYEESPFDFFVELLEPGYIDKGIALLEKLKELGINGIYKYQNTFFTDIMDDIQTRQEFLQNAMDDGIYSNFYINLTANKRFFINYEYDDGSAEAVDSKWSFGNSYQALDSNVSNGNWMVIESPSDCIMTLSRFDNINPDSIPNFRK